METPQSLLPTRKKHREITAAVPAATNHQNNAGTVYLPGGKDYDVHQLPRGRLPSGNTDASGGAKAHQESEMNNMQMVGEAVQNHQVYWLLIQQPARAKELLDQQLSTNSRCPKQTQVVLLCCLLFVMANMLLEQPHSKSPTLLNLGTEVKHPISPRRGRNALDWHLPQPLQAKCATNYAPLFLAQARILSRFAQFTTNSSRFATVCPATLTEKQLHGLDLIQILTLGITLALKMP
ncbi:hypothetical protein BJX65DRAFT_303549 [Aspergillus insuetus]